MSSSPSLITLTFFSLPILFIVVGAFRLAIAKFDHTAYRSALCTVLNTSIVNISAEICSGGGFSGVEMKCKTHQGFTPSWNVSYIINRDEPSERKSGIINSTFYFENDNDALNEANLTHSLAHSYTCMYHSKNVTKVFWNLPNLTRSKDMFLFVTGLLTTLCFFGIWIFFRRKSSLTSYKSVTIINSV